VDWTACPDFHWKIRGLNSASRFALKDPWTEQRVSICIGKYVDWTACLDLHWKIRGLNSVAWFALEDPWTEQCVSICIGRSVDWTACLDLHRKIRELYSVSRFALEDPWTEQCGLICIEGSVDWTAVVIYIGGSVEWTTCADLRRRIRGLGSMSWFALYGLLFVSFLTKTAVFSVARPQERKTRYNNWVA